MIFFCTESDLILTEIRNILWILEQPRLFPTRRKLRLRRVRQVAVLFSALD